MNNQYLYELYGVSSNRSSDTEHANFWQTCSCVSFRGYHSNHFDGYYGNQGSDAIDDVGLKDEPYLIFWSDGGSSLSRSQFNWDYIFFFFAYHGNGKMVRFSKNLQILQSWEQ